MPIVKLAEPEPKTSAALSEQREDIERREKLKDVAKQYSTELDRVQEICLMLLSRKPSSTIFILDWDVIRGYVEIPEEPPPYSGEVSFLFGQANTDFKIPLGAFRELVRHLDKWSTVGHQVRLGKSLSSADEARRMVAKALGVKDMNGLSPEDLELEIESRLDSALIRSKRLTQILSSRRFKGIASDYPAELQKSWKRVVSSTIHRKGLRTKRDTNDSINLAIATASQNPLNILVTQTEGLVELFGSNWQSYPTTAKPKQEVIEQIGASPESAPQNYPVVNARVAAWLDLLNAFKMTGPAMTRTNLGRNSFECLRQELISMIAEEKFLPTELFSALRNQDKPDPIFKHLKELSKVFGIQAETRLLEHTKINHLLERRAISLDEDSPTDSMSGFKRPDVLLKSIDTVYCALERKEADIGYATREEQTGFAGIKSVNLFRKPFVEDDLKIQGPSLTIEFYLEDEPYYSVRWATGAGDGDFASGVANLLRVENLLEASDSLDKVVVLGASSSNHSYWDSGCIVETSCGSVGFPLELVAANNWEKLSIKWLAQRAKAKLVATRGKDVAKPKMRTIRLNSEIVDLVYQCAPDNGSSQRMCALISATPMVRRITSLFAITSSEHCLISQMESSLRKAFSTHYPS